MQDCARDLLLEQECFPGLLHLLADVVRIILINYAVALVKLVQARLLLNVRYLRVLALLVVADD